MEKSDFVYKYDQLKGGTKNYANQGTYDVWYSRFIHRDAGIFSQVCDFYIDQGVFPEVAEAVRKYKAIKNRTDGGKTKECAWCECGKIYATRKWSRRHKRSLDHPYVYACYICYPDGFEGLMPFNPENHEKLATRPKEAGGPVIMDEKHFYKHTLTKKGINPHEAMRKVDLKAILTDAGLL